MLRKSKQTMPAMPETTKADLTESARVLAETFSVPVPGIESATKYVTSYYGIRERAIFFHSDHASGDKVRQDMTLCHEMAHHIDAARNGLYLPGTLRFRRRWHTPTFYAILRDVAQAWYGDAKRYPWHMEYPLGKRWALARGLMDPVYANHLVAYTLRRRYDKATREIRHLLNLQSIRPDCWSTHYAGKLRRAEKAQVVASKKLQALAEKGC